MQTITMPKMGTAIKIYLLRCPITYEVFYIGATKCDLHKRLLGHKGLPTVIFLKARNMRAKIELIESVPLKDASKREAYWMDYYTAKGERLENSYRGGYHTNKRQSKAA